MSATGDVNLTSLRIGLRSPREQKGSAVPVTGAVLLNVVVSEIACFRQSGRRLRIDRVMKVTGKPIRTSVGLFFIGIAIVSAISILPGAKSAQSPFLYVCILGGLFVGIPAALGIGIVLENRRKRTPR